MPAISKSTGVAITNPLVLYRSLIATKRIQPDPAQHRLALHLHKLYERLIDYEPIVQYGYRLQQISRALGSTPGRPLPGAGHEQSPKTNTQGAFSSLFRSRQEKDGLALTKVLTSHEAAMDMDSPRGLMLHGEVGTGKSMLVDLFADCLPNRKKRRMHYSTFMLDTLAKLEQLRRSRELIIPSSLGHENDYSLLWIARDMISKSPILFLDEFQLPDRAAAKIMTNLMTCFFQLGGVLIATSNRMPEELAKAAGAEFAPPPPPRDTLAWRFMSRYGLQHNHTSYPHQSDFAAFLDVLKARCEVWEMENVKDYRRLEGRICPQQPSSKSTKEESNTPNAFEGLQPMEPGNMGLGYEQSSPLYKCEDAEPSKDKLVPSHYFIKPILDGGNEHQLRKWMETIRIAEDMVVAPSQNGSHPISWQPSSLKVYGRSVHVPRQCKGVTKWTFPELCQNPLGPADYVSLASTYHTVVLTDVPILSLLQKNEARRLITLLDALYEARCKLLVSADAGPDELFFPEVSRSRSSFKSGTLDEKQERGAVVSQDPTLSETYSEIYQDTTAPFRPNIASYNLSIVGPEEPDYTHARLSGLVSSESASGSQSMLSSRFNPSDQLEDTPPNTVPTLGRGDSIYGRDTGSIPPSSTPSDSRAAGGNTVQGVPDFGASAVFTGEDERFAYKRAASRLWEMCSARWWARGAESALGAGQEEEPTDGPSWWRPIPQEIRRWEKHASLDSAEPTPASDLRSAQAADISGVGGPDARHQDPNGSLSPFRTHPKPPPSFSDPHFWGMMRWGKRAGRWGQGVEAFDNSPDKSEDPKHGNKDEK